MMLAEWWARFSSFYKNEDGHDSQGVELATNISPLVELVLQYDFVVPLLQGKGSYLKLNFQLMGLRPNFT